MLVACTLCIAFTACSDDDDYTAGALSNTEGYNVYFAAENTSGVVLGLSDMEFTVTVSRSKTDVAENVPLTTSTVYNGIFIVPGSVSFSAGEADQDIVIKVTNQMQSFKKYALTILIDEAHTLQYKDQAVYPRLELTILKEDYEPYAEGTYYSDFFEEEWPAILEYSELQNKYRFSNCWLEDGYDLIFAWDGANTIKMDSDKVETGYVDPSNGMVTANFGACTYNSSKQMFTFDIEWTVSAGSYGEYPDTFTITKKF